MMTIYFIIASGSMNPLNLSIAHMVQIIKTFNGSFKFIHWNVLCVTQNGSSIACIAVQICAMISLHLIFLSLSLAEIDFCISRKTLLNHKDAEKPAGMKSPRQLLVCHYV